MALINCPECGNQISSNARHCIHCGCTFSVCHECNNVSVGDVSYCPQCGYVFKKENIINTTVTEENSQIGEDIFKSWLKSSPVDSTIMRALKIIKFVLYFIPVIFLAVLVTSFTSWQNADELEKLLTFTKTTKTLKSMLALACIFGIFDSLCEPTINAFIKLRCSNWIKKSKIDGVGYLRIHSNETCDSKDAENYQLFAEAVYYAEHFKNKNDIYMGIFIRLICSIATFTSGGVCIMQNLTEAMNAKIIGRSFEFQYISLIVCAVFAVIYFIAAVAAELFNSKQFNAWVKKNIVDSQ